MDVCSQIWLHAFRLMDVPAAFGGANLFIKTSYNYYCCNNHFLSLYLQMYSLKKWYYESREQRQTRVAC